MIELYPIQKRTVKKIENKLINDNKVMLFAVKGSGKTLMSLAWADKYDKSILIVPDKVKTKDFFSEYTELIPLPENIKIIEGEVHANTNWTSTPPKLRSKYETLVVRIKKQENLMEYKEWYGDIKNRKVSIKNVKPLVIDTLGKNRIFFTKKYFKYHDPEVADAHRYKYKKNRLNKNSFQIKLKSLEYRPIDQNEEYEYKILSTDPERLVEKYGKNFKSDNFLYIDGKEIINVISDGASFRDIGQKIIISTFGLFVNNKRLIKPMRNVVVDEVQGFVNNNKRSKNLYNYKFNKILMMTGGLISNHYQDFYTIYNFLTGSTYDRVGWLKKYFITKMITGHNMEHKVLLAVEPKEGAIKQINNEIHKYVVRLTKEENNYEYKEEVEELIYFDDLKGSRLFDLLSNKKKTIYFTKDLQLSQGKTNYYASISHTILKKYYSKTLRSGYIKVSDEFDNFYGIARTSYKRAEVLNNCLKEDRYVIFYNFNEELSDIEDVCRKKGYKLYYINGNKKDFRQAKKTEKCVVLAQYLSGSEGIDGLQKVFNRIIYYSHSLSSSNYDQSRERIQRNGQKEKKVYYTHILMNKSEDVLDYQGTRLSLVKQEALRQNMGVDRINKRRLDINDHIKK